MEIALTGDAIDAATALDWGLVNRVVPEPQLHSATMDLLERATRGSRASKALGKHALYSQLALGPHDAYRYAVEVMASSSQTPAAREWIAAFIEKRKPEWPA
jgi:enoyl-CoA hydratase/carnithine racemase